MAVLLRFDCLNVPYHQMIFIHISNLMKTSHFVVIHFLIIRANFVTAYVSHAKIVGIGWSEFELDGPNISQHPLNLIQSKTNCSKNLNSDGMMIVKKMGPLFECIFRSLLQFLVKV